MKRSFKFLLALLSLFTLTSCKNNSPYIGDNGNWWIGNKDLGVNASGEKGQDGVSITVVSIDKTASENNIDTYTITFSDGSKTTFTVTNGTQGESITVSDVSIISSENGVDTYQIEFSDGSKTTFTVTNGKNITVTSVEKVSSEGIYDTYRILFSDGTSSDFTVTNGSTPYIGDNGNWWIKDVDTGIVADGSKGDNRIPTIRQLFASAGLVYQGTSVEGNSGFVVSDFKYSQAIHYLGLTTTKDGYYKYEDLVSFDEYLTIIEEMKNGMVDILVPNYVGNVPVVGISACFNDTSIKSISLSKNTKFISSYAFESCYRLKNVDFNDCQITSIPAHSFAFTALETIELPESVTTINDYAFANTFISSINLDNIKIFGNSCLDQYKQDYFFFDKNVKFVGANVFKDTFMYVEEGAEISNWEEYTNEFFEEKYFINCKKNGDYIYRVEDNQVTLYQHIGTDRILNIPSKIENLNVTKLGQGFLFEKYFTEKIKQGYDGSLLGNYLVKYDQVIIPNTVKMVEDNTLSCFGALVYFPKSVERINIFVGEVVSPYMLFAFEGNESEMPKAYNNVGDVITPLHEILEIDGDPYIHSFDLNKLYFDEPNRTFYLEEGGNYKLIACFDFDALNLEIKNTVNNLKVTSIKSYAVNKLPNVRTIKIGTNIKTIESNAFEELLVRSAFIPNTVETIGSNAFNIRCNQYVVGNNVLPEGWDHNFCASGPQRFIYNCNDIKYGYSCGVIYGIINNNVTLYELMTYNNSFVLPETIEGKPVTTINSEFYVKNCDIVFYIPSSITRCQGNAFMPGTTFNLEEGIPSGFEVMWDGGESTINTLVHFAKYPVYEDFVYAVVGDNITLLQYNGHDTNIYIPRTIDGKTVVSIDKDFFNFVKYKTSVYIPNTITSIGSSGSYAFTPYESNSRYKLSCYFESDTNNNLLENLVESSYSKIYWNQQLDY